MRFREITEANTGYNIKAKYDQFNHAYFDGVLPDIPVEFAKLKTVTGVVKFTKSRVGAKLSAYQRRLGKSNTTLVPGSMRLQLSNMYQMPEERLDSTLLHEMIHVYFIATGDLEENHGAKFLAMMRKISVASGIRLSIKDDVAGLELTSAPKPRGLGVFVIYKADGGVDFTILSPNAAHADSEAIKAQWERRLNRTYPKIELYTVGSPLWTEMATRYPVKRAVTGLYHMRDLAALDDLKANGRPLWTIQTPAAA